MLLELALWAAGLLAAAPAARAAEWGFERGEEGFSTASKGAGLCGETAAPLRGKGSLRVELAPNAREARTASPEFRVEPWAIYIRLDTAARVGWTGGRPTEVRLRPEAWQAVEVTAACEGDSVLWFQPYFVLRGGFVEIDDLELRSVDH